MLSTTSSEDDLLLTKQSVVDYKKNQKARAILGHLYQQGSRTLAQLAETLHTSIPSITGLVEELLEQGWVNAVGTASGNNGRRPVLFSLNAGEHYVLILDSTTHDTRLMVVNPRREVIFQRVVDTHLENSAQFLTFLATFVTKSLAESGLSHHQIMAVGLTLPGLIDTRRGVNLTYPNLNLTDQPFTDWLEQQLGWPVFLINDTKATALGENRFGGGQGKDHVLSINIDWGLGLGIIINGEVFQGASGFAGELGHIQVDPNGELCHCGKVGCLDTITSASSLVRHMQRAVEAGQQTRLAAFRHDLNQINITHIIEAAHEGDSFAIDLLHETGYQLGKGLSIAVNLFNPEVIIIDGVLAQGSMFITNPIRQAINKHCLSGFRRDLIVEVTKLDGAAKWLGTHAYVMEKVLASY